MFSARSRLLLKAESRACTSSARNAPFRIPRLLLSHPPRPSSTSERRRSVNGRAAQTSCPTWRLHDQVAHRKRIPGNSVAAETRFEARANGTPVGFREPANQAHFPLQQGDGKEPEEGRLMKSRLSPVA